MARVFRVNRGVARLAARHWPRPGTMGDTRPSVDEKATPHSNEDNVDRPVSQVNGTAHQVTDLVYAASMGKVLRVRELLGVGMTRTDFTSAAERNRRRRLLRMVERTTGLQAIHAAVSGVTERNMEVVETLLSVAEEEGPALCVHCARVA